VTINLRDGIAVVTGASSGIGRAIAVALSRQGAHVCILGRNPIALEETAALIRGDSKVTSFQVDLATDQKFETLVQFLQAEGGKLDVLVHSAGVISQSPMEGARVEDLDAQYTINARAPYVLTQRLLPFLTAARGNIVFINSSAGLSAKRAEVGQYGATKHALKAIADSLREEVNPTGIRVLTIYVGRTATPMQKALFQQEGKTYRPDMLMQPEDVASVLVHSIGLPRTAEVTDVSIRPMLKT
jgi:short-subunit dehydrogenase